jgi:hypothetical protein
MTRTKGGKGDWVVNCNRPMLLSILLGHLESNANVNEINRTPLSLLELRRRTCGRRLISDFSRDRPMVTWERTDAD